MLMYEKLHLIDFIGLLHSKMTNNLKINLHDNSMHGGFQHSVSSYVVYI